MVICGIDPGLKGGIAFIGNGKLYCFDMPVAEEPHGKKTRKIIDVVKLRDIIKSFDPIIIFCEKVGALPGNGNVGMFRFGYSAGIIEGIAAGLEIVYQDVSPVVWKKHHSLLKADKSKSRELASKLFPDNKDDFKMVKNDGRAEAALIASYGDDRIP